MYYQFTVYAWVRDKDPQAASQGCGHSHCETINTESVEAVKRIFLAKRPTAVIQRITCVVLGLDERY
jgi:hypothetical protein